jgi:hypothetical protein
MVFVVAGMTASGASNDVFALSPIGFSDVDESEMTNIALGKTASISANDPQLGRRGAGAANDGNIATFFNQNFNVLNDVSTCGTCSEPSSSACSCNMCTLTPIGGNGTIADYSAGQGTNSPWWGIDLGSEQRIDFINIYMRNPSITGGLYTYDFPNGKSPNPVIFASNSNSTAASTCPNGAPTCPYTSVGVGCPPGAQMTASGCVPTTFTMPASITPGRPTRLFSDGLRARYIWLVLPGTPRILSLCEFQVFQKKPWVWRQLSSVTNAALLKRTTHSTTFKSDLEDDYSKRAVDGIVNNIYDIPLSFSRTALLDSPNIWWQVDLGDLKDVLYINVYGRSDCCTDRNTGITWTISSGTDYKYGTKCINAPADITPSIGDTEADDLTRILFGSTNRGVIPTYKSFPCKVRGRYLTASIEDKGSVTGPLMLDEVEVFASNFLDEPTGRFGMSSTVHGGCIVLFGGEDSNGYLTNELRMFDMLQIKWLPMVRAIGIPPSGRIGSFISTLLESTLPRPSYKIAVFGGLTNTDYLNDVNVLQLLQCPMYDTTGVNFATDGTGTVCSHFNTVCYVKCLSGATSANGDNPLVCQMDGTWRGANPPCAYSKPGYPTSVFATTNTDGIVKVTWSPPTAQTGGTGGFGPTPFTVYRITTVASDIYEDWTSFGKFAAPITPIDTAPMGSTYVGGNWCKLIEKNGASISATNPVLITDTFNSWDFFYSRVSGMFYLRLESERGRKNWFDQNDNLVLYRSWPSIIDQSGSWAIETFVSLSDESLYSSMNVNSAMGLLDMSEYFGRGAVEFYSGVKRSGSETYKIGWESAINTFNDWTSTDTSVLSNAHAIYVRIERDSSVTPVKFKSYYKLNRKDPWTKISTSATPVNARNGNLDSPNIRPGLLCRSNANGSPCVGLFSFFRIGPISCNFAGSQRYVSAFTTSALIYGLSKGVSYQFTVEAQTKYGWSRVSNPSTAISIPLPVDTLSTPEVITTPSTIVTSSSTYAAGFEADKSLDGNVGTFWRSDCIDRTATGGQWLQIDLGTTKEIGLIRVTERQDCCQVRANLFQVFVGNENTFWNSSSASPATGYVQCDPSRYNNMISSIAGYTVRLPCYRTGSSIPIKGRYIVIRRNPSSADRCFHLAEVQISSYLASNSIAQGEACTMSTVQTPNVCSFALDGRTETFAQAYSMFVQGWLTVDLGVPTAVKSIAVQARLDAPQPETESLNGFSFRIGDVTPITGAYNSQNLVCNATYADWQRNSPLIPFNSPNLNSGLKTTFDCVANDAWSWRNRLPAVGRYVTMLVPARYTPLNLAELEIIPENIVLVSAGKPCTLSSLFGTFYCSFALDGNPTNFAHSNMDLDNFLSIDLGLSTAVRLVKIINRQDCCQGRSNGFDFYIGDVSSF